MNSLTTPPSWKEGGFWRDEDFVFVTKSARGLLLLAAVLASPCAALAAGDTVSYNNQIGPILSEHCFHCHGPDEGSRKAKLRLDLRKAGGRFGHDA